jgi:uncharacterized protein YdaT
MGFGTITYFRFQLAKNNSDNRITKLAKNQHVVPHNNQWAVLGEGNAKATAVYSTQQEAILRAKEIAQNQQSELLIHGTNGQIRERNSYGNDPFPPKG